MRTGYRSRGQAQESHPKSPLEFESRTAPIFDNCRQAVIEDTRVIRPFARPLKADAGFIVLRGDLFNSAIMKTSVISEEFRHRYLSNPDDPDAFEGPAVVFDGPEDCHARIGDGRQSGTSASPSIHETAAGCDLGLLKTDPNRLEARERRCPHFRRGAGQGQSRP
jgi:dihydroxyacid dehydratase/phosphogluconate dehydratase